MFEIVECGFLAAGDGMRHDHSLISRTMKHVKTSLILDFSLQTTSAFVTKHEAPCFLSVATPCRNIPDRDEPKSFISCSRAVYSH